MDQDARRSARTPMRCEIEFRRHGDFRYMVDLIDFSPEGCRFAPPVAVEPEDPLFVHIPGIEAVHARAAWSRDFEVGAEFDRPFHPAVFDSVVKRLSES